MDWPSNQGCRVGPLVVTFFLRSGGKKDSPKNNKISSLDVFGEKFWKKIFSYFQILWTKFSVTLNKKGWFCTVKKKIPKWKIWVGCAHKTGFSFFVAWGVHFFFLREQISKQYYFKYYHQILSPNHVACSCNKNIQVAILTDPSFSTKLDM